MGDIKHEKPFVTLLDENHEAYKTEKASDKVIKELTFFESFIPNFFSTAGEAESIKRIYRGIKEKEITEKVSCVDVNKGSHIYHEYMDGMIQFINDIKNVEMCENANQIDQYADQFARAKQNDSVFIESINGGNLNENVELDIQEATSVLEYLIDFIPEISSLKQNCVNMQESYTSFEDEKKNQLVQNCMNMFYESVDDYCYKTLRNIINTYYDINNALFHENTNDNKQPFVLL